MDLVQPEVDLYNTPTPKTTLCTKHVDIDRLRRYGHLKFFQDGGGRHLGFFEPEIAPLDPPSSKTPPLEPNVEWIGRPVAEIWPFQSFPRWRRPPSWIFRTGNSAIRSAVPENPTLEPNMEWIGQPVAEIWPFEIFDMRGRSSVGRWSVGRQYIHLISYSSRATLRT